MSGLIPTLINLLYYGIFILLLARMIISISNIGPYELREWIYRLTEPLLAPIRRMLPSSSGVDFSPMILLLILYILRRLLLGFLS